ncbi:MAG: transposase, partial [Chloroflexota bacterium]
MSALPAKLSKCLWVSPQEFLLTIHAVLLAESPLRASQRLKPRLSTPSRRGPKPVYADSSVMVMALIHVAWQTSYDEVVDYFRAHPEAAQTAAFPLGRVISVGQYGERRRAVGILPCWQFFIGMVAQLVRMNVITGTGLILDATTQKVWFHQDGEAGWSFSKPGKGSVWGYKVHTVLCRWSQLPVMFLLTPAQRQESVLAIPLLLLTVVFFGFSVPLVRADAGYFTYPIMNFIRTVLGAGFMIDYNLRRRGKRFLATL